MRIYVPTLIRGLVVCFLFFQQHVFAAWQWVEFYNCGDENSTFTPTDAVVQYRPNSGNAKINIRGYQSSSIQDVQYFPDKAIQSALYVEASFLSFNFYENATPLCNNVTAPSPGTLGTCPWGPGEVAVFSQIELKASYQFSTIAATITILSNDPVDALAGCIKIEMTPKFSKPISNLLRLLPLGLCAILLAANTFSAIFNPWTGTTDIYKAVTNYGKDIDSLRLILPGFYDLFTYIQWVILTACLNLDYPGFFQPVLTHVAWSNLLFKTYSIVTMQPENYNSTTTNFAGISGEGPPGLIIPDNKSEDGIVSFSYLIGLDDYTLWQGCVVWFLIVTSAVLVLSEIVLLCSWLILKYKRNVPRSFWYNNIYFSLGTLLRMFLLFILPLTTFTFYNIAEVKTKFSKGNFAGSIIFFIFIIVLFPALLCWQVFKRRRNSEIFDNIRILLSIGPLYNTYREERVIFSCIAISSMFLRGLICGVLQTSGIAQIVLLVFLELSLLAAIIILKPYPLRTSMNIFSAVLAIIRVIVLLLMISFISQVKAENSTKQWIGYVILVIHTCIIIFGFSLSAFQTFVEITARLWYSRKSDAADRNLAFGLTNVFGIQQLTRRRKREEGEIEDRNTVSLRSPGAESGLPSPFNVYLAKETYSLNNNLVSPTDSSGFSPSLIHTFSNNAKGTGLELDNSDNSKVSPTSTTIPTSLFFRQPRRATIRNPKKEDPEPEIFTASEPLFSKPTLRSVTPNENQELGVNAAAELAEAKRNALQRNDSPSRGFYHHENLSNTSQTKSRSSVDYAVREADSFYYRRQDYTQPLRSNGQPSRRLGTGPINPTGAIAQVKGIVSKILRKNPEAGKFEVIRPPGWGKPPPEIAQEKGNKVEEQGKEKQKNESEKVGRMTEHIVDSSNEQDCTDDSSNQELPSPPVGSMIREKAYHRKNSISEGSAFSLLDLNLGKQSPNQWADTLTNFSNKIPRANDSQGSSRVPSATGVSRSATPIERRTPRLNSPTRLLEAHRASRGSGSQPVNEVASQQWLESSNEPQPRASLSSLRNIEQHTSSTTQQSDTVEFPDSNERPPQIPPRSSDRARIQDRRSWVDQSINLSVTAEGMEGKIVHKKNNNEGQ